MLNYQMISSELPFRTSPLKMATSLPTQKAQRHREGHEEHATIEEPGLHGVLNLAW